MLNSLRLSFKREMNDIKTAFSKRDVAVAILGLTVISIVCYINHNFI